MRKTTIAVLIFIVFAAGCTRRIDRNNPFDPGATTTTNGNDNGSGEIVLTSPLFGYINWNGPYQKVRLSAANSPYIVTGETYIGGNSLVIEGGVTIKYSGSYGITFLNPTIVASGTSANPIKFTSGRTTPAVGDYKAIVFGYLKSYDPSKPCSVNLNYITFEYGSGPNIYGENSNVTNCTFSANEANDPRLYLNGEVKYSNFQNVDIESGVNISYCNISGSIAASSTAGQYKVNYCNLTKGSTTVLTNNPNWAIDATNNWWGTTNAPTIAGYINGTFAGNVTYSPFASSSVSSAGPQ